ncbi:MAG: ABC transporter ATP-binding protein [Propionicimonas sp.]|nr:ABC transporter ATP-binding protein [Propionicimonas sp.]
MTLLAAEAITRRFGDLVAVDRVSLALAPGRVVALIGPNGAGKTSTIDVLCGTATPDGGRVSWQGEPATAPVLRRVVGYCPQAVELWPRLSCAEQVTLLARLDGRPRKEARRRCADVLDRLGLGGKARARADTLSGGMKRRLNLALALVNDPPVLVLDEPEAGLDPQSRVLVRDLIAELANDRAILIASHDIAELALLADEVVVLDHGRVLAAGSPDELLARHGGPGRPGPATGATLEDVFLTLTGRSLRE